MNRGMSIHFDEEIDLIDGDDSPILTNVEFITLPEASGASYVQCVVEIDEPRDDPYVSVAEEDVSHEISDKQEEDLSQSNKDAAISPEHLTIVSNGVDYRCGVCNETFNKRYLVLYHQRLCHLNKLPYVCDVCCKGYVNFGSLLRHQNCIHSEYPFHCKLCGQSFLLKNDFTEHKCVSKLPYVCEGCGNGYTRFNSLVKHGRLCNDYSCYSSTLREYQFLNKDGYNCHTCGIKFGTLINLTKHRVKHHSDVITPTSQSCNQIINECPTQKLPEELSIDDTTQSQTIVPVSSVFSKDKNRSDRVVNEHKLQGDLSIDDPTKSQMIEPVSSVFNDESKFNKSKKRKSQKSEVIKCRNRKNKIFDKRLKASSRKENLQQHKSVKSRSKKERNRVPTVASILSN
jgi:hypothetical protein